MSTFENDIDYVVPLTIRSVDNLNAIPLGLSDVFIPDELAEEQDKDNDIYKIKTWLESGIKPSQKELSLSSPSVRYLWTCESQLHLENGVLYYLWEDHIHTRYLFVVPKTMQPEILKQCNDNRTAGHLGQTKTYEKLKQCAIYYGMSQIQNFMFRNVVFVTKTKSQTLKLRQL